MLLAFLTSLCIIPCSHAFFHEIAGGLNSNLILSSNSISSATRFHSMQRFCSSCRSTKILRRTLEFMAQPRASFALSMAIDSTSSGDQNACIVMTREKLVKTFRSFASEAGVECKNITEMYLSMAQIESVMFRLGYSKQEIECVFKQIDANGKSGLIH